MLARGEPSGDLELELLTHGDDGFEAGGHQRSGTTARGDLRGALTLIAVDTNILVNAHRPEMRFRERAGQAPRELAGARA